MCYNIEIPVKTELSTFINCVLDNKICNNEWDESCHIMSGFTFSKIPVLTTEDQENIQTFNWGLIPKWCKDEAQAKEIRTKTLNAKCETIFEKPSFRASIKDKRCLVFVKGFYEWRDYNNKKYPYYIHLKKQEVFTLGGIYESWVNKNTGEIITTTSIITTAANPLMAKIHNLKMRMPLILPKNAMHQWLNPLTDKKAIENLMQPFDENKMSAHSISKLITSRRENPNQAKIKEAFIYKELPQIN